MRRQRFWTFVIHFDIRAQPFRLKLAVGSFATMGAAFERCCSVEQAPAAAAPASENPAAAVDIQRMCVGKRACANSAVLMTGREAWVWSEKCFIGVAISSEKSGKVANLIKFESSANYVLFGFVSNASLPISLVLQLQM